MAQLATKPTPVKRVDYEHFMPMVRRTAIRLARRLPAHIDVADLVSAGWVGLMESLSRAGADMPADELDAYASYRVRGAMLDYLRTLDPATRHARNASKHLAKTIKNLTQALGRPPTEEEIAGGLGITLADYHQLLNTVSSAGMTRLNMVDFENLEAPASESGPEEAVQQRQLIEAVMEAIDTLPERLQHVVALYYQEGCTLRDIGAVFNVSESRACQLHAEAMHRLRAAIGDE